MTTRDLKNNIDLAASLDPAVRPTGTYNGTGVDLLGYQAAALIVHFGAYTNGTHTPGIEHSDDNTSYSAVTAADLDGALSAISASAAGTVQKVGYRGGKRYLRATMVVTSGATGAASSAAIVRGVPNSAPV